MLSAPNSVKEETYLVQVVIGLLEPLEGMLHLPLSSQPILMGPSLNAMLINHLWMKVYSL